MSRPNTNCLAGLSCPSCGHANPLNIEVRTILTVHDDGASDVEMTEWDCDSVCGCPACGRSGTVADFTARQGGAA